MDVNQQTDFYLEPGDIFQVPKEVVHWAEVLGDSPVEALMVEGDPDQLAAAATAATGTKLD